MSSKHAEGDAPRFGVEADLTRRMRPLGPGPSGPQSVGWVLQPGRQIVQDALSTQAVEEHVFAKVGSLEGDVNAAAAVGSCQVVGFDNGDELVVDGMVQVDRR